MLSYQARQQYVENQVQTTPGKRVVLLYDSALKFLHVGLGAMDRCAIVEQSENLGRAVQIVGHLVSTLDLSAGHIAYDLRSIYLYCMEQIMTGNVENRPAPVEEVIKLLSTLRDAWDQAERQIEVGPR